MKKYILIYLFLIPAFLLSCGRTGGAGTEDPVNIEASESTSFSAEDEEVIVALPSAGSGSAADSGEEFSGEEESVESGPDGKEGGSGASGAEGSPAEVTEESGRAGKEAGSEEGSPDREETSGEGSQTGEMIPEKTGEDSEKGASEEAAQEAAETDKEGEDGMSDMQGFSKAGLSDEIKQRINGLSYKSNCTVPYEDLRYLRVLYVDFTGQTKSGEIICNKKIADDLLEIFENLYNAGYQIDKIRLVDEYGADDDLSCADDNTSCFNFRLVEGTTKLSKHAMGMAIDINPFYNPYITYPNGSIRISPPGSEGYADRNADFPHKIDKNDLAYKEFVSHGFTWGGDWKSTKDYQHFQKG